MSRKVKDELEELQMSSQRSKRRTESSLKPKEESKKQQVPKQMKIWSLGDP